MGIAPWNAPVILGVRAIAMPLACGNTVVFKSSESCPAVHRLIGTVLHEAGIPAGVINVLSNDPADAAEIVGGLIDHALVRHINFTGSTRVGRMIAVRAAQHLKPVLLELGGKAPLIVLDDADLAAAVNAAAFGAFMNRTVQLRADVTGSIIGYVRDSSGAVLPKATLTVTQTSTGYTRTATTDGSGAYSILALPPES